ncbi:putative lipoprotein [Lyngbya aestuarii BL J]|uniref:Putative lipoprotein n=1 Tax=Lyngbya aestuarii BL J TaxID=1348334 RepID=U7QNQ0_9CYAN|nr:DarT ssDNA thymidine ADP-ribosyltransferase family protein [Lyngbya aestuarii]ERT08755.1 putative lipoprotein [Lyngbya aestuarii BL J]
MSTPIYHITHIDNLVSILSSGGLIACSQLRQQQVNYTDLAHENIQDRRANKPVADNWFLDVSTNNSQ